SDAPGAASTHLAHEVVAALLTFPRRPTRIMTRARGGSRRSPFPSASGELLLPIGRIGDLDLQRRPDRHAMVDPDRLSAFAPAGLEVRMRFGIVLAHDDGGLRP